MPRVVEEVPLDPPRLVKHLLPERDGFDPQLHAVEFHRSFAGLRLGLRHRRLGGSCDRPLIRPAIQHLFAVERHGEAVDIVQELLDLALAEIEFLDRQLQILDVALANDERRLGQVENAGFPRQHVDVVARGTGSARMR